MKLLSNFHDYYDCGAANGIDTTIVYNRQTTDLPGKLGLPLALGYQTIGAAGAAPSHCLPIWVGVCGRWYLGCELHYNARWCPSGRRQLVESRDEYLWGDKAIAALLQIQKRNDGFWRGYGLSGDHLRAEQERYDPAPFIEHGVPLLLWLGDRHPKLTANPRLASLQFQKVIHPIELWERISQFISNDLVRPDPMPVPSDKTKILAHGFDLKSSFRKEGPPTRKSKKK